MLSSEPGFLASVGAAVSQAVFRAADLLYGPWTIAGVPVPLFAALLFAIGLFLTVRFRFVQLAHLREAVRSFLPVASAGQGVLSPFQSFMTALAATIGTGNIAGVATAVVSGGPGAIFWIWCYGFFATAIKFTEAVLGVRYRSLAADRLSAGPMRYLSDGLGLRRLGWTYALVAGVAALTTTPFTQPNSIAVVLDSQFGMPTLATGILVAVMTWLVIIGGVTSIGRAAEKLSPAKVILYLVGGVLVLVFHADRLPGTIALVFREAFSTRAAMGSVAGAGMMMAMRYGLARGMYANEAGYGTAAFVYGTARSDRPVQQGYAAVMEVFVISFMTSTISALTILVTGVWRSGLTSTAAVAEAFNHAVPVAGGWVVAFCAFLFGYTTLIGWAYYGEQCLGYLFGPRVITPYRWVYCGLIVLGAVGKVDLVWAWGDLMNGLQVFPNVVGVVGLSGVVAALLREDESRGRGTSGREGGE
jgi:AGCS family alanine or glycine:cation symporter